MVKCNTKYWSSRLGLEVIAAIIQIIFGTIFHFVYEWSDQSSAVCWFVSIDESVFSHLVLTNLPHVFTTLFIFSFEYYTIYDVNRYYHICLDRAVGLLFTNFFIISIFYFYTSFVDHNLYVDIITFVLAIVLGNTLSYIVYYFIVNYQVQTVIKKYIPEVKLEEVTSEASEDSDQPLRIRTEISNLDEVTLYEYKEQDNSYFLRKRWDNIILYGGIILYFFITFTLFFYSCETNRPNGILFVEEEHH
jgi:hypothetical protein